MSADAPRSPSARARPGAAGLAAAVAAALTLAALASGPATAATTGADRRAVISVDAGARGELLAEMRAHVANLQRFLDAVAKNDLPAAAAAARASGIAAASEAGDEIGRDLPPAFTALGMSLHADFDRLADAAARGDDARSLVGGLAAAMQKCVACHASYRLGARAGRSPGR